MTALQLARTFAREVAKRDGVKLYPREQYGVRVRNARESKAHGYMSGALATVTYESSGIDMIEILGERDWAAEGLYIEAYASYMVGVYRIAS